MRGKEISLKFDHKSGESNTLSISLETPFEKFEKTSYSLVYTGTDVTKWTESTEFEYYYGKVSTRVPTTTTFIMQFLCSTIIMISIY